MSCETASASRQTPARHIPNSVINQNYYRFNKFSRPDQTGNCATFIRGGSRAAGRTEEVIAETFFEYKLVLLAFIYVMSSY